MGLLASIYIWSMRKICTNIHIPFNYMTGNQTVSQSTIDHCSLLTIGRTPILFYKCMHEGFFCASQWQVHQHKWEWQAHYCTRQKWCSSAFLTWINAYPQKQKQEVANSTSFLVKLQGQVPHFYCLLLHPSVHKRVQLQNPGQSN